MLEPISIAVLKDREVLRKLEKEFPEQVRYVERYRRVWVQVAPEVGYVGFKFGGDSIEFQDDVQVPKGRGWVPKLIENIKLACAQRAKRHQEEANRAKE